MNRLKIFFFVLFFVAGCGSPAKRDSEVKTSVPKKRVLRSDLNKPLKKAKKISPVQHTRELKEKLEPAAPVRHVKTLKKKKPKVTSSPTHVKKRRRQKATRSTNLPSLLAKVSEKYGRVKTIEARFTQVNFSKALGQKKKSQGELYVERPKKIRWETKVPDPSLLVSDGKTFWFYTPPFDDEEPGQVIIRRSKDVQSELMDALLTGSFSRVRGMKIQEKPGGRFVLIPRRGSAGSVRRAEVFVEAKRTLISKVKLIHSGGNTSEIALRSIRLGPKLKAKLFQFEVPKNTEVIRQ